MRRPMDTELLKAARSMEAFIEILITKSPDLDPEELIEIAETWRYLRQSLVYYSTLDTVVDTYSKMLYGMEADTGEKLH